MQKLKTVTEDDQLNCYLTCKKCFKRIQSIPRETILRTLKFAYEMTFGEAGQHRNHRSGGIYKRKNGELFRDTFQGKLAEFAIYIELDKLGLQCSEPNLEAWPLGRWDHTDIEVQDKKMCVKSAKHFSNLLLLETKDWNKKGEYIPNLIKGSAHYDFFTLVRIAPSVEEVLKSNQFLYSQVANRNKIEQSILSKSWDYDIPGFLTHSQIVNAIIGGYILPQNSFLNGKIKMDAENYYIQAGDMTDFFALHSIIYQ